MKVIVSLVPLELSAQIQALLPALHVVLDISRKPLETMNVLLVNLDILETALKALNVIRANLPPMRIVQVCIINYTLKLSLFLIILKSL